MSAISHIGRRLMVDESDRFLSREVAELCWIEGNKSGAV